MIQVQRYAAVMLSTILQFMVAVVVNHMFYKAINHAAAIKPSITKIIKSSKDVAEAKIFTIL